MNYAIFPRDIEFNHENFREAKRALDRSAASINDTLLSFLA